MKISTLMLSIATMIMVSMITTAQAHQFDHNTQYTQSSFMDVGNMNSVSMVTASTLDASPLLCAAPLKNPDPFMSRLINGHGDGLLPAMANIMEIGIGSGGITAYVTPTSFVSYNIIAHGDHSKSKILGNSDSLYGNPLLLDGILAKHTMDSWSNSISKTRASSKTVNAYATVIWLSQRSLS